MNPSADSVVGGKILPFLLYNIGNYNFTKAAQVGGALNRAAVLVLAVTSILNR